MWERESIQTIQVANRIWHTCSLANASLRLRSSPSDHWYFKYPSITCGGPWYCMSSGDTSGSNYKIRMSYVRQNRIKLPSQKYFIKRQKVNTGKSLSRVDFAWLILPLFRQSEANLSQVSTSSVGGSTSARTAKSDCHTWAEDTKY